MPSTYTLNNGIELIGTGEQSGTWGDTTNTNLELLDTALDGQVTVTLSSTGSGGSPNTLPISDGSSSNGRNRLVVFNDGSDIGGTVYVQLTPNDAEKIIYVRNSLSGSRSILLFQGTYNASNDYEIPAGTTAIVFFNGGGTGAVAANVFNNAYFDGLRLGSVSVDKILDEDNMASNDAAALATQQSIKAYVDTQVGANNELSEVLANGNTTGGTDISVSTGDDITFADSSKAIFGAGSDLSIYHDGGNSLIQDAGQGDLILKSNGAATVIKTNAGNNLLSARDAGSVGIFHDNSEVLTTTSTGIDVTGTAVMDGLTVDGVGSLTSSSTELLDLTSTGGDSLIRFGSLNSNFDVRIGSPSNPSTANGSFVVRTAGDDRLNIANNGDITFYDSSGNASFVYDESAGSTFNEQGADRDFRVESNTDTHALFVDGSEDVVVIGANAKANNGKLTLAGSLVITSNSAGSFVSDNAFIDYVPANRQLRINAGAITGQSSTFELGTVITGQQRSAIEIDTSGNLTINEDGADKDFRVESDGKTHMLFVDAAEDQVLIGESSANANTAYMRVGEGAVNLNGTDKFTMTIADGSTDGLNGGLFINNYQPRLAMSDSSTNGDWYDWRVDGTSFILGAGDNTDHFDRVRDNLINVTSGETIMNSGGANRDFRVESDSNTHALFVEGDNTSNRIKLGMGTGTITNPYSQNNFTDLNLDGTWGGVISFKLGGTEYGWIGQRNSGNGDMIVGASSGQSLFLASNGNNSRIELTDAGNVVVNPTGADNDFRVESDSNSNMLFVDAGDNQVVVGASSTTLNHALRVAGSVGGFGGDVADTSSGASRTLDIPISALGGGRGTYMASYFSYGNGGAQQNGFTAMIVVMTSPDRAAGSAIWERYATVTSITYSGSNVRIVFTANGAYTHQGGKISLLKLA